MFTRTGAGCPFLAGARSLLHSIARQQGDSQSTEEMDDFKKGVWHLGTSRDTTVTFSYKHFHPFLPLPGNLPLFSRNREAEYKIK